MRSKDCYLIIFPFHQIRVHYEFKKVFSDGLYDRILDIVSPLLSNRLPNISDELYYEDTIHFAGHGLGGANAQLFGTYYAFFRNEVKTHITTFGAPRQGNYAYKILGESLANLSVWRVVNCRDAFPREPGGNFFHSGHTLWRRCNEPGEDGLTNDVVEAYYRESGDEDQNYAGLPGSFDLKRNEPVMVSDNYPAAYSDWLDFATLGRDGRHWTSTFESTDSIDTPDPVVAANIDLPSPPLPLNEFADQPLGASLASEMAFLSTVVYEVNGASDAARLLKDYNFHFFDDTGSTEVMIISSNHNPDSGVRGKIMVVFRGTDQTEDNDWITNIDITQERYGPDNALLDGDVVVDGFFRDTTFEVRYLSKFCPNGIFNNTFDLNIIGQNISSH